MAGGLGNALTDFLRLLNTGADTTRVLELATTGANAATTKLYVGSRDPVGVVTASPGEFYLRVDGNDSALYQHAGTGADNSSWESSVQTTRHSLDLYIDPVGGDDANDGLTSGAPVQSPERLDALMPALALSHRVRVHCAAGTYSFARRWFISNRVRLAGGCVQIFADEAWDPGVVTVLDSGTLGGGTTNGVLKVTSASTDLWRDRIIRITTGDCAGLYRTIRNNTTTDVIPDEELGNVIGQSPAAGDGYEIIQLNVVFQTPDLADAVNNDVFFPIRNSGQGSFGDNNGLFSGDGVYDEVRLIRFDGSGATGFPEIVWEGNVSLRGVESNCRFKIAKDAYVYSGSPYDSWDADAAALGEDFLGCGISFDLASGTALVGWGTVVGYVNTNGQLANHGVLGVLTGGRAKTVLRSHMKFYGQWWGSIRVLIDDLILLVGPNASDPRHDFGPDWTLWGIEFGTTPSSTAPRLQIYYGFRALLGSNCIGEATGATTVYVRDGHLDLYGAPNLGKAVGTDWSVNNGTDKNKSFFNLVGNSMVNLGTLAAIVRTD